jgi:hypothetical protein
MTYGPDRRMSNGIAPNLNTAITEINEQYLFQEERSTEITNQDTKKAPYAGRFKR